MNLQLLLEIKLKQDLVHELNNHFNDNSLKTHIEFLVNQKIKENKITIDTTTKKVSKENQCYARSMGPRYSDIRCPRPKLEDKDYCKLHLRRLDEYDYLLFGRYDEPRPIINEKGNKIPWRDSSAMEDIDTLIQYQHMNLYKLINK